MESTARCRSPGNRVSIGMAEDGHALERVLAGPKLKRSVSAVGGMRSRKQNWEGVISRLDAPSALFSTITPQFTLLKARELYGGAPRPLSARHEFIKKTFLSDTEDWRSNAFVGNRKSGVANINITDTSKCTYLEDTGKRSMSYYREKSLSRAVSYRQILVKKNGDLAENQYADQYMDRESVKAELLRSQSRKSVTMHEAPSVSRCMSRSMSRVPDRALVTSLSRCVRPESGKSTLLAGAAHNSKPAVEDRGMGRALSRIMTRSRVTFMGGPAATGNVPGPRDELGPSLMTSVSLLSATSVEECPRMEDL